MPRDKSENSKKIIAAAQSEFMKQGFESASMRSIASQVGMTVGALYRHFPNKEELFAALVEPAISELMALYEQFRDKEYEMLKTATLEQLWKESDSETKWLMRFIYDHIDAFKLLICRSQGTRYENFEHELALLEERSTLAYFDKMKEYGLEVTEIPREEFHILVTANVSSVFEAVKHGLSDKEAMHYADTLDAFFSAGWKKILGI